MFRNHFDSRFFLTLVLLAVPVMAAAQNKLFRDL